MTFGCAIGIGAQTAANQLITDQILKSRASDARRIFKFLILMTAIITLLVTACLELNTRKVLQAMLGQLTGQVVSGQIITQDRDVLAERSTYDYQSTFESQQD